MRRSDRELEELLARGLDQSCPDLEALPQGGGDFYETLLPLEVQPRRRRSLGRLVLAACLCLALLGGGAWAWFSPAARIVIRVNPALMLTTNCLDRVLEAEGLNEDGEELLEDLELEHVKLDTAVSALMGALSTEGYLSREGAQVRVTVSAEDPRRAARLEAQVADRMNAALPEDSPADIMVPAEDGDHWDDDLDDLDDPDDLENLDDLDEDDDENREDPDDGDDEDREDPDDGDDEDDDDPDDDDD